MIDSPLLIKLLFYFLLFSRRRSTGMALNVCTNLFPIWLKILVYARAIFPFCWLISQLIKVLFMQYTASFQFSCARLTIVAISNEAEIETQANILFEIEKANYWSEEVLLVQLACCQLIKCFTGTTMYCVV
jgi:hypothetical protein